MLDRVNLSKTRSLHLTPNGQLHPQVATAVAAVLGNPFRVLVLSYCHREYTRQNVRRACFGNPAFNAVAISDKPTQELGKLSVLRQVISEELLESEPCRVYHIDDSWEVLTELRDKSNVVPIGIKLYKRGFYQVPGVHYEINLFGAIEYALRSEQRFQ